MEAEAWLVAEKRRGYSRGFATPRIRARGKGDLGKELEVRGKLTRRRVACGPCLVGWALKGDTPLFLRMYGNDWSYGRVAHVGETLDLGEFWIGARSGGVERERVPREDIQHFLAGYIFYQQYSIVLERFCAQSVTGKKLGGKLTVDSRQMTA